MSAPRWLQSAKEQRDKDTKLFDENLGRIAIRLAHHDKSERVARKHVQEAFRVLERFGMSLVPWWKRPELYGAIGGFLTGFAWALPSIIPLVWKTQSSYRDAFTLGAVGVLLVAGVLTIAFSHWRMGR